jgi:DNA-binding MarR family transcriptional regulator
MHPALGLAHTVCVVTIALEPGISINELAERTGYPQQSVSRYISLLLGRYETVQFSGDFYPLVEQRINTIDPRKRALFLTTDGEKLVDRLIGNLDG